MPHTPFAEDAPFVEVDGTTLRWDPREVTNPLLGSVHDPIYQGARRDLAESGVPEPRTGLVTDAHGGVLFIDEIGEMDPLLQNKLLKVLEDKRVSFESAYYDANDPNVPKYIKKLFEEGAPADFVLIGATTRDPERDQPGPALPLRRSLLRAAHAGGHCAHRAPGRRADRRASGPGVEAIIADYTIEGRKAVGILADAYGLALYRAAEAGEKEEQPVTITEDLVYEVIQSSRLSPYVTRKASPTAEVGRIFGLGVLGFVGSVLEIEAVAFPAARSRARACCASTIRRAP